MASRARSLQPGGNAGYPDWIVWTPADRAIPYRSSKRLQNICLPRLYRPVALAGERTALSALAHCVSLAARHAACGKCRFLGTSIVLERERYLAWNHSLVDVVQLSRTRRPLRRTTGTAGGISFGCLGACTGAGPTTSRWNADGADDDQAADDAPRHPVLVYLERPRLAPPGPLQPLLLCHSFSADWRVAGRVAALDLVLGTSG